MFTALIGSRLYRHAPGATDFGDKEGDNEGGTGKGRAMRCPH